MRACPTAPWPPEHLETTGIAGTDKSHVRIPQAAYGPTHIARARTTMIVAVAIYKQILER